MYSYSIFSQSSSLITYHTRNLTIFYFLKTQQPVNFCTKLPKSSKTFTVSLSLSLSHTHLNVKQLPPFSHPVPELEKRRRTHASRGPLLCPISSGCLLCRLSLIVSLSVPQLALPAKSLSASAAPAASDSVLHSGEAPSLRTQTHENTES